MRNEKSKTFFTFLISFPLFSASLASQRLCEIKFKKNFNH